jgi:hypothetical protein
MWIGEADRLGVWKPCGSSTMSLLPSSDLLRAGSCGFLCSSSSASMIGVIFVPSPPFLSKVVCDAGPSEEAEIESEASGDEALSRLVLLPRIFLHALRAPFCMISPTSMTSSRYGSQTTCCCCCCCWFSPPPPYICCCCPNWGALYTA